MVGSLAGFFTLRMWNACVSLPTIQSPMTTPDMTAATIRSFKSYGFCKKGQFELGQNTQVL
jgi:hypothetical protein